MRPGVVVSRDEITSVSNVTVVEVIVGIFDEIFETDANSDPADKLFNFNSPLNNFT